MRSATYDVIIPTHRNGTAKDNSLNLVLATLETAPSKPHRVLVVNNGETPGPDQDQLRTIRDRYHAECFDIPKASRAAARNVGATHSAAEYLLFLDDDIIAPPQAIHLALERASPSHFCCGARRKFLSMALPREDLVDLVQGQAWNTLDKLADHIRVPEPGWSNRFNAGPGIQHHSTYVGCFGLVPRRAFHDAGGFDERFEGWGLEDTEFMRRLLGLIGFRSLQSATVWHLDHLVSPYIWQEHWGRNLHLYCDRQRDKPLLELQRLFAIDSCEANDPNILIPPPAHSGHGLLQDLPLSPDLAGAVRAYVEDAEHDDNVAAVVLTGSALNRPDPEDLDLDRVLFLGDTACKNTFVGRTPIDEHILSLSTLRHTIHKPFFYPETWPWIANRYASGLYIHQKIDLRRLIQRDLSAVLNHTILHLLTFHLGRSLQAAARDHVGDRLEALRHVAVLGCLAAEVFPDRMRHPYSSLPDVRQLLEDVESQLYCLSATGRRTAIMDCLSETVVCVATRHDLVTKAGCIYYGASDLALRALGERGFVFPQTRWGRITNDHHSLEATAQLYGFRGY